MVTSIKSRNIPGNSAILPRNFARPEALALIIGSFRPQIGLKPPKTGFISINYKFFLRFVFSNADYLYRVRKAVKAVFTCKSNAGMDAFYKNSAGCEVEWTPGILAYFYGGRT